MRLDERLRNRIRELDQQGLRRALRPPTGLDLCSNDYLGLSQHPRVTQAMAAAVLREGAGSTGSRLLRGERDCFEHLESRFAEFKGTERSLYFSSGYLANLAVLTAFPEEGDTLYCDERNHASLIDGARLSRARKVIFPHNDANALARLLENDCGPGQRFVITESLFSMDGDEAPLQAYAEICKKHGAALIVDEAHAAGVFGARGSGLIEAAGIGDAVFASVNTAGKALGVSGAFVAGATLAIEWLIQHARTFIFSTAGPPALAAAIEAALDIIEHEPDRRKRLLAKSRRFRARMGLQGCSQIVPVIVGENERAVTIAEQMQSLGFDVRAIRPPTVPPGTARLRVSVNDTISEHELDRFADALQAALTL